MLPFYAPLERLPLTASSSSGATIVANFLSIFYFEFWIWIWILPCLSSAETVHFNNKKNAKTMETVSLPDFCMPCFTINMSR